MWDLIQVLLLVYVCISVPYQVSGHSRCSNCGLSSETMAPLTTSAVDHNAEDGPQLLHRP